MLGKLKSWFFKFFAGDFWRFRHLIDKNWTSGYASAAALSHPHRAKLLGVMGEFEPLNSVLEVGCATGPNLILLAQKYPEAEVYGLEVSREAVKVGKREVEKLGLKNMHLSAGNAGDLSRFADKSVDVVFSDACLIYINENKIEAALRGMLRVAKKGVVICELTSEVETTDGKSQFHNYRKLFNEIDANLKVEEYGLEDIVWTDKWQKFGKIIKITI